jgi:hypothetical protein
MLGLLMTKIDACLREWLRLGEKRVGGRQSQLADDWVLNGFVI